MHTIRSKSATYRGVVRTQKAGEALLAEDRAGQGAARWIRIRVKAIWLIYRTWKVTRGLRAKKARLEAQMKANERGLPQLGQRHAR